LERLCRYVARGAIATDRLSRLPDGRVHYRLRKPFWDGTRAVIFEPLTFIEKLAALIPPPRRNLVSYHGVFAPNSSLRQAIIPQPESKVLMQIRNKRCRKPDPETETPEERCRRYSWAELLKRVFNISALRCPYCGNEKRKLIAMITEPPVIRAILQCLGMPCDPPALRPALRPT